MAIIIVDWEKHFENSQSKRWENLRWVPIPNKQGIGYKKIMQLKNGAEVFGCWIAIVECASRQKPRGIINMSTDDLSLETMINNVTLLKSIEFLCKLSWLIVDSEQTQSVLTPQNTSPADQRSILFNSIHCNSLKEDKEDKEKQILELYAAYPKKVGKGQAIKAIGTALNKCEFQKLLDHVKKYALSVVGKDPQFVPHPATWFNGLRWEDQEEIKTEKQLRDEALAKELEEWGKKVAK